MRYLYCLITALALTSIPASALQPQVVTCSTLPAALRTALDCSGTDQVLMVPINGSAATTVLNAYTESGNYQATVPCEQEQALDGRILVTAGVTQGSCSAGQLGTTIANPQTRAEFAAFTAALDLRDRVQRRRRQVASDAAAVDESDPTK